VLAGVMLVCCPCAFGLDPALDVSQYAHTAWKIRDGFTRGETVLSIAQTPDGYLWLGTEFGLVRFDGVRAVPWQPPGDQHLPPGGIIRLLGTRDGTLWIGTHKGLASWKEGKLTHYPELAEFSIPTLLEDREGVVWAGGWGTWGIPTGRLCAIQKGSVRCYGEDGSLGRGVAGLYEDSKGNLWVGVQTGVWRWRPGPPRFFPIPDQVDGIQAFGAGGDGALLIGTRSGIRRLVEGKFEPYPLSVAVPQVVARRFLRDRNGGLWVATQTEGLMHLHQGRIDMFSPSNGLSGENVYTLFEDREGSIWVATNQGLDRFRDFAIATLSASQGLSNSTVGSILADRDGSVWLGTFGGLSQWKNGQITIARTGSAKRDGKINGLYPNSLFQDDRGRTWVSTLHQFGYLENESFVSINGVPGGNVHAIIQDTAGNLWIANQGLGLFRLSARNEVQQIPWVELGHKDYASVLVADPTRGGLWIGFFLGGIAYFDDGQIRRSYAAADGLGGGSVNGFQFDQDGTLWVATEGGLSRLKDDRIATLTSKNGLPCDSVRWVMEDNDRSFWLYMTCGLVRVDRDELDTWAAAVDQGRNTKQTIQASVFDSSDGVRILRFGTLYSPKVAKTADGRIWFLPTDGVSVVDPHHLPFNKLPPPVHVEQITADRKTYDASFDATGSRNGKLRLPPQVRDVEIEYTALSFVAPEKNRFRYMLEGFDRDWHDVGNRRQAFYTNLPPRQYRFRVAACNNSGVWNEAGAFLDFSVAPAYYQTVWFRAVCVAIFLAFLWGLYQLRLAQLRRQMEVRVDERMRIATELHDTLLQGFHGLLLRLQAARNKLPGRPEEAMRALDGTIMRAEQAVAEGRDAIQDLRSEAVTQKDLVELLAAEGQELEASHRAEGDSPVFSIIVEGERPTLSPDLCRDVYRMARELLRNAFRHARAHRIETEVRYDDGLVRVRIRDDGTGIDPKVLQEGGRIGHFGLPGVRARAERIGAQLDFWSEVGAGTEVQLTIPAAAANEASNNRTGFKLFRKVRIYGHRP
jgi:signal transduction histidine kinase/ligand-binding sensor domain-containing protein